MIAMRRSRTMTLWCLAAMIAGGVAGPALQGGTFTLIDGLLPHPQGWGSHNYLFGGVGGACRCGLLFECGVFWAQFLMVPLTLSYLLPSRLGARACILAALLMAVTGVIFLGTLGHAATMHEMLLYFGFPLLCLGVLTLRAVTLMWKSCRGGRSYSGKTSKDQRNRHRI